MKTTLFLFLFLAAAALAGSPNILYFYVDDMGWGSIGPNGQAARKAAGKPWVQTPNIDRIAARGINFTRGYGCHVCSPARSSQQTGFHQGHTFADRNDPDNAKKAIRKDDVTMGDVLQGAGYATGYWGKWGYGGSKDMENPVIQNVQTLPTSHGYQHVLAELHHVRAHTFFQPTLWSAPAKAGAPGGLELKANSMAAYRGKAYPQAPAFQSHPNYPKTAYCDDTYAFAALDFVRRQAKEYQQSGKPFFGLFAAQIPHAPFGEISKLPKWDAAYRDQSWFAGLPPQSRQWAAMVTRIDAHFGNILAVLEEAGITKDTLVIFQSDNGGPGGTNNASFDANGGLRGNKGSIYEGGIRVPLVMCWPGTIKPGQTIHRPVDVTDLLPTFCELAGVPAPLGLDGVSIAPTLTGKGVQRKRPFLIHEAGNGQSIIRGKHKLVRGGAANNKGKKGKKKDKQAEPGLALFDLEADHAEAKNAKANAALVAELKDALLAERVAEPKGFANTYHHWTGKAGAKTSLASNWSDYVYANAGITYTTEDGAPQLSWIAHMKGDGAAVGDANLAVLGLELGGTQRLRLNPGINLTARNELRISDQGQLHLEGGTISSQRWVEVGPKATLSGHGTIGAALYQQGTLALSGKGFVVAGTAHLGGRLVLGKVQGKRLTLLKARRIVGRFSNPSDEVVNEQGERFKIDYSETAVTLTRL